MELVFINLIVSCGKFKCDFKNTLYVINHWISFIILWSGAIKAWKYLRNFTVHCWSFRMKFLIIFALLFIAHSLGEKARFDNYRLHSVIIENEQQLKAFKYLEEHSDSVMSFGILENFIKIGFNFSMSFSIPFIWGKLKCSFHHTWDRILMKLESHWNSSRTCLLKIIKSMEKFVEFSINLIFEFLKFNRQRKSQANAEEFWMGSILHIRRN